MRVKLDENLPALVKDVFTGRGHDADTVVDEHLAGAKDPDVLAAATAEARMLITLERGLGDIRAYPPGTHHGIVVLRPAGQDPDAIRDLLLRLLEGQDLPDLVGCIAVVEPDRVRVRRPPP